jgi:hypothetical protein
MAAETGERDIASRVEAPERSRSITTEAAEQKLQIRRSRSKVAKQWQQRQERGIKLAE